MLLEEASSGVGRNTASCTGGNLELITLASFLWNGETSVLIFEIRAEVAMRDGLATTAVTGRRSVLGGRRYARS